MTYLQDHQRFIRAFAILCGINLLAATSSAVAAGCWIPLFDGLTLNGWTSPSGQPITAGWKANSGVLHLDLSSGRGGNILTEAEFANFELVFEWKIAARGNSGIKYRVKSFDGRILGCEYQMIDDHNLGGLRANQRTAALYDVYEPSQSGELLPAGQYNRGRILVCGHRIEHWLNGRLVVAAVVGSREWRDRIASSKFSDVKGFGENTMGKIMLTDHNSEIWLRNVFVRDLATTRRTMVRRRPRLFRRW